MKKLFEKTISLLLAVVTACSVCAAGAGKTAAETVQMPLQAGEPEAQILSDEFEKVLENSGYALYLQTETYNIAVLDKANGIFSYTFPIEEDTENIGSELVKNQLRVYYYDDNNSMTSLGSYADCVLNENASHSVEGETLSVVYKIGDTAFQSASLPRVLTKKRMENDILAELDDSEREIILKFYTLYSRDKLNDEAYKSVKRSFPLIAESDLYIRGTIPDYIAEGIYALFEKAGYTAEDLQRDCDENKVENEYKEKPFFVITVNYRLTDDGFSVSFTPEKTEFAESYQPVRIELLPFFGAADNTQSGYMLVPDGCGSVINFNNGKTSAASYWKKLFNDDGAIPVNERTANTVLSVLPVFALSAETRGFLATIDSGYEIAGIACGIFGKSTAYNNIYPFFDISSADTVTISSNSMDSFLMLSDLFSDEITVSYHLTEGNTDYSEFAAMYRSVLQKSGILPNKSVTDNTILNIDFIGTAAVTKRFLGIPYETVAALTTYSQAIEILKKLGEINTDITFSNSLKGGYYQKNPASSEPLSVLGSKKERQALEKETDLLSFSLYAQRAAKIRKSDAVKAMNRSNAYLYGYNTVSRFRETEESYLILSPLKLDKYATKLIKSLESNALKAVSFLDLGYELNSDFNTKKTADRGEARHAVQNYLEKASGKARVSVDTGSVFSFPYIDKIRNIPVTDSGYAVEDYSVPFYQLTVSGLIPYTAPALNTADDMQSMFLTTVECGAQLSVNWIYKSAENTVRSAEKYYGLNYADSLEKTVAYIKAYSELYGKISGVTVKKHTVCSEYVRKTEWENGICVYVNYGSSPAAVDGITIEAQSFCYTEVAQ